MVDTCSMCRSGATRGSLELPAEALNLMIGGSEVDVDDVSGPIHISFCEDHWTERAPLEWHGTFKTVSDADNPDISKRKSLTRLIYPLYLPGELRGYLEFYRT